MSKHAARCARLAAVVVVAVACADSTEPAPPAGGEGPTTHQINIRDFAFAPSSLTLSTGDRVEWRNVSTTQHTVTENTQASFNSGTLGQGSPGAYGGTTVGETFSWQFSTAGTFNYHCDFHPDQMRATIVVE